MAIIPLPKRFSDNFGDPIQKIFKTLENISTIAVGEEIILDYSSAKFTHPFFSMSLPLIMEQFNRKGRKIELLSDFTNPFTRDYMSYLNFPAGFDANAYVNEGFREFLNSYSTKRYIPIINFPVGDSTAVTQIRDQFLSAINQLLVGICGVKAHMTTALMYLIDEAVNNVLHHSFDDRGYLLAQYFPTKGYADIVIADIGRTILESYENSEKYQGKIETDREAMEAALAGKSTKSNNVDRGFGISTSKEMLTKGLNGKYFLWSGNVCNIHNSEINNIINLPQTVYWQGAFLCLRIPVVPLPEFDPYKYMG